MANVPPEIMNHLRRSQLQRDGSFGQISIPRQRRGEHDEKAPATSERNVQLPPESKGLLSRLALKLSGPELSGD